MFSRIKYFTYFSIRKLEYSVSVQTLGFGVFLLLPPVSLQGSAGLDVAAELMSETAWGLLFLVIGWASLWCLHVNGAGWWTPFGRMATMMACILALAVFSHGFLPWSPGAYYFLSVAFFFCGNAFLAASRDAGQEIRRWRHGSGDSD